MLFNINKVIYMKRITSLVKKGLFILFCLGFALLLQENGGLVKLKLSQMETKSRRYQA